MARLRTIYGDKVLGVTGAELLSSDRSRCTSESSPKPFTSN
jgi:hypothetical protein